MEKGGGMSYRFFPTTCITTVGEMPTAQSRSCLYLPAKKTGPQHLLSMALPSFCPSTTLSLASASHPQYGKALSVNPIRALKFQKKLPERHSYPAATSTTVFPCYKTCLCMDWYTGSDTQAENTLNHLAISSSGVSCYSFCLASTPARNTQHHEKEHTFGIEVVEFSETQEWRKLTGSRLRKGLTTQKLKLLPE